MARAWEKQPRSFSEMDTTTTFARSGVTGLGAKYRNVHTARLHENYNGSGSAFYGGAKSWPVLTINVGFQVGQEAQRDELAQLLMKASDDFLKQLGQ